MSLCPTEATLQQLEADALGEMTYARIEEHVESCEKCQRLLQLFVKRDPPQSNLSPLPVGDELPPLPGFRLEGELGRGSHGAVYLAREISLDRPVALKIVPTGDANGAQNHSTWLTEAQKVSRPRHPNVVQLYQVIEIGDRTIMVLEYVPGGTLKDRLSTPLTAQDAARVLESIARTIAQIHKAGLLHLDIKPSNILVDGEPGGPLDASHLKVSDFGISRSSADPLLMSEGRSGPGGTPSYMAPEQAGVVGASIGPGADVYGLGALLYHLLTGRPPFQSPSARETLELIGAVDPVPPRQLNPRIPRDLEVICLYCLRRLPEQRYASADALADDLRRFLEGRRISVRPAASIERVARWCRRRPAIAALAITLAVTIVASIGSLASLLRRSESDRLQAVSARRQAEKSEAMASQTLEELEGWIQRVVSDPNLLTDAHLPALIDNVQRLTENLHGDGESTLRMAVTVSALYRDLAVKLTSRPRASGLPEAAALLARSRRLLTDCLRRKPDAELLQNEYVLTLLESGSIATMQAAFEEGESYFAQVAALAPTIQDQELRVRSVIYIFRHRYEIIFSVRTGWRNGNSVIGIECVAANQRMLDNLLPDDAALPDLRLLKALTLSARGLTAEAIPILRELTGLAPTDWLRASDADGMLHEWLARDVIEGILWNRAPAGDNGPVDLDREAQVLIDSIHRQAEIIGLQNADIPAIARTVSQLIQRGCAAERRWKKVEREHDSAQRFVAFAERIASAYPDRCEAHVLVGEAYDQVSKNARYFDDDPATLVALRNSLAAARRAQSVAPESQEVLKLVAIREQKLKTAEKNLGILAQP